MRLGARGLVPRALVTQQLRGLVSLTPKGRALVGSLVPVAAALERAATRGVSKAELTAVKHVLRQMHRNLTARRAGA